MSTACINFDETSHSGEMDVGLRAISIRNKDTTSDSQQLQQRPVVNAYNSLQECCEAVFGSGVDCSYLDICSIKPVDSTPTNQNVSDTFCVIFHHRKKRKDIFTNCVLILFCPFSRRHSLLISAQRHFFTFPQAL